MRGSIEHFYVCLGCGSRRAERQDAIACCAVVQEIWECGRCGGRFATETAAEEHSNCDVEQTETI